MAFRYEKKSKYNSKSCSCNQGHNHDSRGEAGYCNDLALQVKGGIHHSYETQVRFDLHGRNGKKVCAHYVDFLVYDFDGNKEVHEYKGVATDLWKLKKALFEHEYQDIPYNVIYHKKSGWRNFK